MHDEVHSRVARLREHHERLKEAKHGYLVRPLTLVVGWAVLIIGLITIPLPGQGWLTTFLGLGILSFEVAWAHRLLGWGVHQYERFFRWYKAQSRTVRYALVGLLIVVIWIVFACCALYGIRFLPADFPLPQQLQKLR